VLEGNPDELQPLSRGDLDARLKDNTDHGYRVFPDRVVKIKEHQDNVQFAAMGESMDESFGRVLAKLDSLGLADHTIVLFTSDNGGMSAANFGRPDRVIAESQFDAAFSTSNLPLRGGKGWLYEGGIRVPLLIRRPGQGQRGLVCDVPVISTDLYPSILEMIGVPLRSDQHRDGVSLAPLLTGTGEPERTAIYWHFPHYSNHGMQSPGGAIRAGDDKLLEYFENDTVQLFNLREDPEEQHDRSREDPETAERLKGMLHRWRENVGARTMEVNPEFQPAP
jgi:arylsulfatase A-like enzyme